MALKFLNKKGWHTGSLRNIENVWKAEQKHEAEQKKLEELRKQIRDERERSEFRLLQEQAGLVARQERLDFLYDSGLAVGKGSSSSAKESGVAFKALEEAVPATINKTASLSSSSPSVPGALFEDKPHSANDAWRKLHSDPLLLIRQREQEALSRIKNNPVQMALIRKSVETYKKEKPQNKKERRKKHKHSSYSDQSDSEDVHDERKDTRKKSSRKRSKYDDDGYYKAQTGLDDKSSKRGSQRKINSYKGSSCRDLSHSLSDFEDSKTDGHDAIKKDHDKLKGEKHQVEDLTNTDGHRREKGFRSFSRKSERDVRSLNEARSQYSSAATHHGSHHKRQYVASKLSEEERAAMLQEMQVDAELHEEQRWKRLKKAEVDDVQEAARSSISGGRNFLDAAQRSMYGTGRGGSSTIEESVRRRVHYSQGKSEAGDGKAFRR